MSSQKRFIIDTTVDIVCPFCAISSHHLDTAIQQYNKERADSPVTFDVRIHPFILDSSLKNEAITADEYGAKKFGEEKWEVVKKMKADKFAAVGLPLKQGFTSSTVPAHRLLAYAQKHKPEAQWPLTKELFMAHHGQGLAPADNDLLSSLAVKYEVFPDNASALSFVRSDELADEVQQASDAARASGVKTVPYYIFQETEVSPNSKAQEEFLEIFRQNLQ